MIASSSYGKSRVRLVKVERHPDRHDLRDITVDIRFTGDYDESYTEGDNSRILPTDTMKNTVYALAAKGPVAAIESFGTRLAEHFLEHNSYLTEVRINIAEHTWNRMDAYAFHKGSSERRVTAIDARRGDVSIHAGIGDLVVLKTTKSGFEGYIRDSYTTLPETSDRILATAIQVDWHYAGHCPDFDACWGAVRNQLLGSFSAHESRSVQHTLYAMGEGVLREFTFIDEIRLTMPNKHCIPVNLEPLGMENRNEIFVPIDEPHGLIETTLRR